MGKGMKKRFLAVGAAALLFATLLSPAFSGTTHTEGGPVNDAADSTAANGSSFRVYNTSIPAETVTGTVGTPTSGTWRADVGFFLPTQWNVGDDHVAVIDKEIDSGLATHKGYYSVINKDLTSVDPDIFNTCTLREIPIPSATAGNKQVSLSWSSAAEDAGAPARTNVAGYNVLRSTSATGPFTKINASTIAGTSYTDSTAVNGTTYYYVIQLVYRATAGTNPTSLYTSANSSAVTPVAPATPVLISASPASGYRGDSNLNVTITGSNTNFVNGTSVANFGADITVNSTTVTSATQLTANISINTAAATGARNVSVTTGAETATGTNLFTVNAPSIAIAPTSGDQGWTGNIVVSGTGSHFINGTTGASFSGSGITVNSVTVASTLSATVNVTIDPAAATGARTLTVSTSLGALGTETVTAAFTVAAGTPATLSLAGPASGYRGDSNLNVTITGSNTNFVNGTSVANFGADITVNSTTVTSATQLTANISIGTGAALGLRSVTVTTGGETATGNIFTVMQPSISINPNSGDQGWTGNIVVSGTGSHFINGTTGASFSGSGITVNSVTVASTLSATVNVTIDPAAATGARILTVSTSLGALGTETVTAAFTVTDPGPVFDGVVIDDYEFYAERDHRGMMDYYYESGSGVDEATIAAPANSTTVVQEGVRSMEIGYPGATGTQWGGYWGGGLTLEAKTLTPYSGISLWVKGDGTSNTIAVSLKEADVAGVEQEAFVSIDIPLTDTSWHKVEIPFSSFVRDPYGVLLEGTFSKVIKGYTIVYRGTQATAVQHFVDYLVAENVSVSNLPTVTDVTPDTGQNDTATPVVVTGTNFGGVTSVKIGTWDVSSFTVDSATQISAVIQSGLPVGTYHVTVTNPYGTSATSAADQFTVTAPTIVTTAPAVTGIDPDTGVNTTSTEVTITGTNLDGATSVRIGTVEMTIVSVTPTQIVAIVPPGIRVGDYHITVTTPNGTSPETPNDIFTVTEPTGPVLDDTPPVISDVRFDGKLVMDGDFVGRTPVITALLTDDVAIDPSSIRVRLVNNYDLSSVPAVTFDPATGRMQLIVTSPLPYGPTEFTINVSDTSGNSAEFRITLNGNDGTVFNYPNPFDPINGTTKIAFNISEDTQVAIYLFDMTGRIVVKRVFTATTGFNEYEWDGIDDYGTIASNGVYLLRLVSGSRLIGKTKVWVIKR